MVRTPDDYGAGAARRGHCHGALECAQREPRSGQSFAVPIFGGSAAIEHVGCARLGHATVGQFVEVGREQRQAMRRVPEQVRIEQHRRNVDCDVGARTRAFEQRPRELSKRFGAVAKRGRGRRGRGCHREW